ncbi:MAG: quinolinate synthase NadA [Chloroflexia bacterium]
MTTPQTETKKKLHPALMRFFQQDPEEVKRLQAEVRELAKERQAVIMAHNYQVPEIQDVADFVGDSLGLAVEAAKTTSPVIVLCGVYFMAETAKLLNPTRIVIIPDETAGCSLADSITVEQLRDWKAQHPNSVVVSYVNTTADIKAETDICVTSGNAQAIIRSIPEDKTILFLPDMYLGQWLKNSLKRDNMLIWAGECHVHAGIRTSEIYEMMAQYPDADLLIHPECGCTSRFVLAAEQGKLPENTFVLSTEGMIKHSQNSPNKTHVVATETGILHRLQKENPERTFIPADRAAVCRYMKQITIEKLRDSLRDMTPQVEVPAEKAEKARLSIERMLAVPGHTKKD